MASTVFEKRLILEADRLDQGIKRLRNIMKMHGDHMPNEMMIPLMDRINLMVGHYQSQLQSAQEQLRLLRLTGGDLARQFQVIRAQKSREAWDTWYNTRVSRMPHGPWRQWLERVYQDKVRQSTRVIGNSTGQSNLPDIPVLTRDPEDLAKHADFQVMFEAFSARVPKGSPSTPDRLEPDVFFDRHFRTRNVVMPDGRTVEFWGFTDPSRPGEGDGAFPSDPIRIKEGVLFHCRMKPRKGTHTIHWHGIEPTAMNDGVGKLSFEVNSEYTYQWYAAEAGTYFYHCHHNTPLHFEFGMYGALIIDPPKPEGAPGNDAPYPIGGPGYIRRANDTVPYDVEAIWVYDDVDPRWHEQSHDHGLGLPFGEDAGHNRFDPAYFMITGVPHPWSRNDPTDPTHPGVAATVRVGQTLLVRIICAAYTATTVTIEGLDAEVIAWDARTLGHAPYCTYSQPYTQPAGTPAELTAARRFDALIRPTAGDVGDHTVRFDFYDYIKGTLLGTAETVIHVLPAV